MGEYCKEMKAIDRISKPCTFWYEDTDGNDVPFDWQKGMPNRKWHAQHSKSVLVQHTICFGHNKNGKDLWPVKLAKWLIRKMPDSWKKPTVSFSFNSTINCCFSVVEYLIQQRNFTFNDACVAVADACERCMNILIWEAEGKPVDNNYLKTANTNCKYCEEIDPEYVLKRRVWACYRTMRLEGDIAKAFKEMSPNSREGFFDDPKNMERLNGKV